VLVDEVQAVLSPQEKINPSQLVRTFTLRTGEGFSETFGPRFVEHVMALAPGVTLRFLPKLDKESNEPQLEPFAKSWFQSNTGDFLLATKDIESQPKGQ